MIKVFINGEEKFSDGVPARTLSELTELAKTVIDPDNIITEILINDNPPTDAEWRSPLGQMGNVEVRFLSSTPDLYVADKLRTAESCIQYVIDKFALARENFETGDYAEGTKLFSGAIKDLQASLEWLGSILSIQSRGSQIVMGKFPSHVGEISLTCEQLLQQQMYQSWWAISETIQSQLNPGLSKLRDLCASGAS